MASPRLNSPVTFNVVSPSKPRKRPVHKEKWKRNVAKKLRYAEDCSSVFFPKCNHQKESLQCKRLTKNDIFKLHKLFHKTHNKVDRDIFLSSFLDVSTTKRKILPPGKRKQDNLFFTKYILRIDDKHIPVCRGTFLGIFHSKLTRIRNLSYKKFRNMIPQESRGGDRMSIKFRDKKQAVIDFILSLDGFLEKHYCPGKTARQNLPTEMNIELLAQRYNYLAEDNLKVKPSYFRSVFKRNFKIGFGSPRINKLPVKVEKGEPDGVEKSIPSNCDLEGLESDRPPPQIQVDMLVKLSKGIIKIEPKDSEINPIQSTFNSCHQEDYEYIETFQEDQEEIFVKEDIKIEPEEYSEMFSKDFNGCFKEECNSSIPLEIS